MNKMEGILYNAAQQEGMRVLTNMLTNYSSSSSSGGGGRAGPSNALTPRKTPRKRSKQAGKQAAKTKTKTKKSSSTGFRSRTTTGMSSGFFRKGGRKSKRPYKNRYIASRKGVLATFEVGGVVNDPNCVYVGHTTCPPNRLRYMMLHAIVKAVMAPLGNYPESVTSAFPLVIAGDIFQIAYKPNSEPLTGILFFTFTFGSTGDTPDTVVNSIMLAALFLALTNQVEFLRAEYIPHTTNTRMKYYRVLLSNAKLTITSKSSFKVQNRSISDILDEDSDAVDNVPLYGKSYFGTGNGTQNQRDQAGFRPFIAHNLHGIISRAASSSLAVQEPPNPYTFSNVKSTSKIHLDPGQIKTSVLYYKAKIPFYRLLPAMFGDVTDPIFKKTNIGKFSLFALERMIHALTTDLNLYCAYEHNLEMSCFLTGGYPPPTARIFQQNFYDGTP